MNEKKAKAIRKAARKRTSDPSLQKYFVKMWKKLAKKVKNYKAAIRKV